MSEALETYHRILNEIKRYVQRNAVYQSQRDFGDNLDQKNSVRIYQTTGDCADRMEVLMMNASVPFLRMQNHTDCFLIPDDAEIEQKVIDINRTALEQECCYCQEAPAEEMENAIARIPQIKDKGVVTFDRLTQEEYMALRRQCGKISEGFLLGTAKYSDGTYSVSVHAPDVYAVHPNSEMPDFAKAWLTAVMTVYGENGKTNAERMQQNLNALKEIMEYDGDETKYAANHGRGGFGKMISYDRDSVQVLSSIPDHDGIAVKSLETIDRKDSGFAAKLRLAVSKMGHLFTGTGADAQQHLISTISDEERKEYKAGIHNRDVIDAVDRAVRQQMEKDGMEHVFPEVQLKQYAEYASEILDGAATGEFREGPFSDIQTDIGILMLQSKMDVEKISEEVCPVLQGLKERVRYHECSLVQERSEHAEEKEPAKNMAESLE